MPDSRGDAHVHHPVVTHEAWLAARRQLMEEEKAWTRQGEEISRLQHALPWEVVAKDFASTAHRG